MNTPVFSKIVANSVWLILALLCALSPAWCLPGSLPSLTAAEIGILALVTLASMVAADSLNTGETSTSPLLSRTLAAVLAAATALFLIAWSNGLFIGDKYIVLAVLVLFGVFRHTAGARSSGFRWPGFLSTGVVLLGSGPSTEMAKSLIQNSRGRFRLVGQISWDGNSGAGADASRGALVTMARKNGANALVVAFPERRGAMPVNSIMRCRMHGITVMDVPCLYEKTTRKLHIESTTPSWFIFSPGFNLSTLRCGFKRVSDLLAAAAGLALALPFLPLAALLIKADSPGPVFFYQTRTGLGGRPFTLIKLRTMRADAERATGACWAGRNDSRVTRVGRFLRKTRLDELPQLVNVLFGHMSLIGPRPERPEFIRELEKSIPFYPERHCVKPGITGWAQVRYRYGASAEDALEKLRFDLYYIKNQSFLLDMEIILRTIGVVLLGSGAR